MEGIKIAHIVFQFFSALSHSCIPHSVAEKSDQQETKHHSESWRTQVYYAGGLRGVSALKIWALSSDSTLLL